jgi:hypothetical protein
MAVGGLTLFFKIRNLSPASYYWYQSEHHPAKNWAKNDEFPCFLSRDFAAETRRLEEGEGGEAAEAAASPGEPPGYSRSKKRTLEELFKPPLDIMHKVPVRGQSRLENSVVDQDSHVIWPPRSGSISQR